MKPNLKYHINTGLLCNLTKKKKPTLNPNLIALAKAPSPNPSLSRSCSLFPKTPSSSLPNPFNSLRYVLLFLSFARFHTLINQARMSMLMSFLVRKPLTLFLVFMLNLKFVGFYIYIYALSDLRFSSVPRGHQTQILLLFCFLQA